MEWIFKMVYVHKRIKNSFKTLENGMRTCFMWKFSLFFSFLTLSLFLFFYRVFHLQFIHIQFVFSMYFFVLSSPP